MKTVLTIAGSDSSGGAGIQADIKTMITNGVYAMSAITALTAQNTVGVQGILPVSPEFLSAQLDSIFTDIPPDSVKIGMIPSAESADVVREKLLEYNAKLIVLDPVMIATSGAVLTSGNAIEKLFPLATLVTPNIPEAEVITDMKISNSKDMEIAALKINDRCKCAVLIKGGHCADNANDLLCNDNSLTWLCGKRINNPNTHGTGCTLSSAIASNLAKGYDLKKSVVLAKEYITKIINNMLDLGKGNGPLNHERI